MPPQTKTGYASGTGFPNYFQRQISEFAYLASILSLMETHGSRYITSFKFLFSPKFRKKPESN